nr:hypothetical protein [uncultured Steroidobacter sp.]
MATRKRAKKKQSARGKSTRKAATRSTKKSTKKKSTRKAAKRTLIAPRGDKRYVRRSRSGRFKESDDVSASLSADRRRRAKRKAKPGQGDKGD